MARFLFIMSLVTAVLTLNVAGASLPLNNYNGSSEQVKLQSLQYKPRIFILSDILNEPDDSMSLIRYLLYSNEFDTRGICAITSWWLPNATHPEEMKRIIQAYGEVVENLNNHVHPNASYQHVEELLSLVTSGPATYGRAALNETLSEGASRIISSLQESQDPLYITAWGGTNTLAQALAHMDLTMSPSEASELRSRIRLYTISDQDDTGAWIRRRYPDLFYIVSIHSWNDYQAATWTGINLATCECVEAETVQNPWLDANIRLGPLGSQYPQIIYGMEGDTPSFLWLVQNGLGYRDRIDWGTWGGRYNRAQAPVDWDEEFGPNHLVNVAESVIGVDGKTYSTPQASIWRWRSAYQDDFAARMQWTLTSNFTATSHPPVINVNGHQGPDPLFVKVSSNQTYTFDASLTYDPDYPKDNSKLSFEWVLYPDPTKFPSTLDIRMNSLDTQSDSRVSLDINDAGFSNAVPGRKIEITAPQVEQNPDTGLLTNFHILLQVTNSAGKYPIRRYVRIVCEYET